MSTGYTPLFPPLLTQIIQQNLLILYHLRDNTLLHCQVLLTNEK